MLALLSLELESTAAYARLREMLPVGLSDADNARAILSTLTTGILSLAVFSFSMVMVVLNGAASRLSPRVLPGLIRDTRNRIILGAYLGSTLFFLVQLAHIEPGTPHSVPSLGVLLSLGAGALCMALFVVFISSVSQSIRVDWVVDNLFTAAKAELAKRKRLVERCGSPPDDSDWWVLRMRASGYLREINEEQLGKLLAARNLVARLQVEPGFFLVEDHPLLRLSAALSETEATLVLDCFDFGTDEFASSNAAYGLRQLSEIAVKAISPAINDPGTAIRIINIIGVLLAELMNLPAFRPGCFDGAKARLYYRELTMREILFAVLGPIRTYGSHDPQVVIAVMQCLKNVLHCKGTQHQLEIVEDEIEAMRDAAATNIESVLDRKIINEAIDRLNSLESTRRRVSLL